MCVSSGYYPGALVTLMYREHPLPALSPGQSGEWTYTLYIYIYIFFFFFFLHFFGSNLLCLRDTPYVTHQNCRPVKRGEHPRQALIKPDLNYESRVSPPSLPLNGGSSRGQAIPACFGCAPQYYPKNIYIT